MKSAFVAAGVALALLPLTLAAQTPATPARPAAPAAPAAPAGAQTQAQTEAQRAQIEQQLEQARRELEQASRQVAELSAQLGTQAGNQFFTFGWGGQPSRALLGVQVENDSTGQGARVIAVSPGGAAEAAGIRVGDRITAVGGTDLPAGPDAGRALVERIRQLEPGLKVKVTLLRDGRKQDVDVTPREAPHVALRGSAPGLRPLPAPGGRPFTIPLPPPDGGPVIAQGSVSAGPGYFYSSDMGGRFQGMEFASLSERLGTYFGVKAGVLVVRAGSDNAYKLQDGDVILSIDGREPTGATHAGRILRSYQAGEKLRLRVQRDRKPLDLEVTVPGPAQEMEFRRGRGGDRD